MAVDMFFKIGDIEGESQDADFMGWIDVLSWSWGGSSTGSLQAKSSKGAPSFSDLSMTKFVDTSTEDLLRLLATGTEVPEARVVVRRAGDVPTNYIQIVFKPVIVTSVATGGSGGEDRLTESIQVNFGSFEFTYTALDEKGGADPQSFGWDIVAGAEITVP